MSVAKASIPELLKIAGEPGENAAEGTLNASAQVSGTLADPRISATVDAAKGQVYGEPFDRLAGKMSYAGGRGEVANAEWIAGSKRITLDAALAGAPGKFPAGRLTFEAATTELPLNEIQRLATARPGVHGTLQASAKGSADLFRTQSGQIGYRITDVNADVYARRLQMDEQRFGDAHLTAETRDSVLRAHLVSDFAGSVIRGDGEWRLAGDYPGGMHVGFSRVNLARVRDWVSPATSRDLKFSGSMQGDLDVKGPALQPELWTATLRVPEFQVVRRRAPT